MRIHPRFETLCCTSVWILGLLAAFPSPGVTPGDSWSDMQNGGTSGLTNPFSLHGADRCAKDMTYLGPSLSFESQSDPAFMRLLAQPLDTAIQSAGGLDRAIVLTRLQIDSNRSALAAAEQTESASRSADGPRFGSVLHGSAPGIHSAAMRAISKLRDLIMLNEGALQAFECRKRVSS
jgi:hypothetical protein